jgi:hypothetical protein
MGTKIKGNFTPNVTSETDEKYSFAKTKKASILLVNLPVIRPSPHSGYNWLLGRQRFCYGRIRNH